jgi:hypothetical protein
MTDPTGEIISQLCDRARFNRSANRFFDTEYGETKCNPLFALLLLWSAISLVGLLILLVKLFGPSGKTNLWGKPKYVPPHYHQQHKKALESLAKPLTAGALPLGHRMEWRAWQYWQQDSKELCLPAKLRARNPHVLIVGTVGTGKTRLMAKMITHDIESNDRAVVVIDSGGNLTELIRAWLQERSTNTELAKRITIIDPIFDDKAVGYNPLEMPADGDLQSSALAVAYAFKAMYKEPPGSQSQWNAQTANILRNCAMLLSVNGKTLSDLPTLLTDHDFRDLLLEAVEKLPNKRADCITLLETWGQYKRLARTDSWVQWVEPILNRVTPMLSDSRIRSILTSQKSDIDLSEIINNKGVLLVRLPKGNIDHMLGCLIVTGLKRAAISLANQTQGAQNPAALYLDHFDNLIEKDTLDTLSAEREKIKVGLIGSAKTLQNLPEDFRNSLIVNAGTIACFAVGKKDGEILGPMMFRVDGRGLKRQTISSLFTRGNTEPDFEYICDEEKLNIDRLVGQESGSYYCYQVGTIAGVFHLRSHKFGAESN